MERVDAKVGPAAACANSSCPDAAMVPTVMLFGKSFPQFCPACGEASLQEERERERRSLVDGLWARSGVTPRMRGWTLESSPCEPDAIEQVRSWLNEYRRGSHRDLFLYGPVGRGKTGLAFGVVRELVLGDPPVAARLVNWRNLLSEMQQSFDGGRRITTEPLYGLSVLALDDIGSEPPTDWRRDELATLIEHRYQRLLPTVFTSNYDLLALRQRWGRDDEVIGARITSRIAHEAKRVEVRGERDQRTVGGGSGAAVVRPSA